MIFFLQKSIANSRPIITIINDIRLENLFGELEEEFKSILSLMTAIASSSNLERVFSKFGMVHNEIRNRLGVDTASRLVYLHHTLNQNVN